MGAVPGGVVAGGTVGNDPMVLRVSGPTQGGYSWLTVENATVEGSMDGENWTALSGDTVAGNISRFNVIGIVWVRISGAGGVCILVA